MEREIIKNSIFKQTTYANRYRYDRYDDEIEKCRGDKELKTETICDCKIALPLLNEKDQFYIEEIDLVVQIGLILRTSKDNVLYMVYPKYEDDTDEEMEKSRKRAEKEMEEYRNKQIAYRQETNKRKYDKEGFWFKLFHKFENYDWEKR